MVERQGTDGSQFVVLYHASPIVIHWDILIRVKQAPELLAWRCLIDPSAWFLNASDFDTIVTQLPNHRLKYLDFTGSLSGARGWVTPVVCLGAEITCDDTTALKIYIGGHNPPLKIALRNIFAPRWSLHATCLR